MAKTQSLLIAFIWVLAVASIIMSVAAIRPSSTTAAISSSSSQTHNVQPQWHGHHWGHHHGHGGEHERKL
ncbi:unnamed protein product [Linum trigynum]|uniref:Uncharacterized protein n=1 Tax=Linum trigynum TaxID=586398 RepID=A0AAV2DTY7_9ROSI